MSDGWDLFDDPTPQTKNDSKGQNTKDLKSPQTKPLFSEPQVHFKVVVFKFIQSYSKQSKYIRFFCFSKFF